MLSFQRPSLHDFGEGLDFDQINCQGNAYINADPVRFYVTQPAEFAPDGTVRVAPTFDATTLTVRSHWADSVQQCTNQTLTIPALATEVGPNLRTLFTPPFSVIEGSVSPAPLPANNPKYVVGLLLVLSVIGLAMLRRG